MSYIEELYFHVDMAFSMNFAILQNLARLLPEGKDNIFYRDFLFREKTYAEQQYENYYEKFAEIRNEKFAEVRNIFNVESHLEIFREYTFSLISKYNKIFGKNLSCFDIFSDKDIINWDKFNLIFQDMSQLKKLNSEALFDFDSEFAVFLNFYNEHRDWVSAYEIFEVLEDDITPRGSKSLYFGQPSNPNVMVIDFDTYHDYSTQISKFLLSQNKKHKRKNKNESFESQAVNIFSLNTIIDFYNKMESRFGHANTHLMELDTIWSKLLYTFSHASDGNFEVDKVYVHRNELLTLISAMENFPELNELANQISLHFFNKNVVFYQNIQKENT